MPITVSPPSPATTPHAAASGNGAAHLNDVTLASLYRPLLRRWRVVVSIVAATWCVALGIILIPERDYVAEITVAAVPSASTTSLGGGLSSLIGSMQLGGVQATPFFITRLLLLRGVVDGVALSQVEEGARETVIERVLERPTAEIEPEEVLPAMRDLLMVDVDKQTGLVTLSVTHPDSSLARLIAQELVSLASMRYTEVARAQASQQRRAGEALVDSTRRQLRAAEQRLQSFQASHRVYEPYAAAALERQRLEQATSVALTAYNSAVAEHQTAIAREIEESPAIVIVDPLSDQLLRAPRHGALKMLLATALGFAVAVTWLALRGEFARTG